MPLKSDTQALSAALTGEAIASTTARLMMVLYCRCKNASAPCRMASEIFRICGVPVSFPRTYRANPNATSSDSRLMAITRYR